MKGFDVYIIVVAAYPILNAQLTWSVRVSVLQAKDPFLTQLSKIRTQLKWREYK